MPEPKTNSCAVCGVGISRAASLCRQHQQNGSTPKPLAERLWAKVNKTDECWLWTGSTDRKGYGKIGIGSMKDGTRTLGIVPRVAWEVTNGSIPAGLFVCHKCDNPICCRPDHLFLGTQSDNLRDMAAKGRGWNQKKVA